jgi:hypothetical protein
LWRVDLVPVPPATAQRCSPPLCSGSSPAARFRKSRLSSNVRRHATMGVGSTDSRSRPDPSRLVVSDDADGVHGWEVVRNCASGRPGRRSSSGWRCWSRTRGGRRWPRTSRAWRRARLWAVVGAGGWRDAPPLTATRRRPPGRVHRVRARCRRAG